MILAAMAVALSAYAGCVRVIGFEPIESYRVPAEPDTSEVRGEPARCGLFWEAQVINDCKLAGRVVVHLEYMDKDGKVILVDDTNIYNMAPSEGIDAMGVTEGGCADDVSGNPAAESVVVWAKWLGTSA